MKRFKKQMRRDMKSVNLSKEELEDENVKKIKKQKLNLNNIFKIFQVIKQLLSAIFIPNKKSVKAKQLTDSQVINRMIPYYL